MFKTLRRLVSDWAKRLFPSQDRPYRVVFAEELPDQVADRVLYVLGEGQHLWSAAFLCPCGCGDVVHLSLHPDGHPRWRLDLHPDGTASLWPSIQRLRGCKSHFFFERGAIRWCSPERIAR